MKNAVDDARVTFNQDVWWTPADGFTRLIDDLDDRHRANIAGWLVKHAAHFHQEMRMRQLAFAWLSYGGYDGEMAGIEDLPTEEEDRNLIRKEQDQGKHLDWIRGTVLFQRMIRGLPESALPPGTLRSAAEAAREDFL